MKINSNIYDIYGNLLRKFEDTTHLDVNEAETRLRDYQEKLSKLPDDKEHKHEAMILSTYIKNLQSYMFNYYIIHPEEYAARVKTTEQQVKDAMEELKAEVDGDEYVPFEEVKDEQGAD